MGLETVDFIGQYVVGRFWDRELKKLLQRLDGAKERRELALHAD